jgi:hypothetical protein
MRENSTAMKRIQKRLTRMNLRLFNMVALRVIHYFGHNTTASY